MSKNITCFLIDDDKDDQEIFSLAVEKTKLPVTVVTADDGYLALQKFEEDPSFHPDFIFLDLNMPRINGMQCLQEIKANDSIKHIPVIIFSTSSEKNHRAQTSLLGAEGFITKPSSIKELAELLEMVFNELKQVQAKH